MHDALRASPLDLPLALSMGDACGIGPEIIVAQWGQAKAPHAFVVGSVAVMKRAQQALLLAGHPVQHLRVQGWRPGDVWPDASSHVIPVWEPDGMPAALEALPWGQVHAHAGRAAALCVRAAAQAVQQKSASAMVTAPLHKEALALAGEPYPGHTELLQAWATPAGQPLLPVRMMLANDELKTVLVSIHMALRQAIEAVTFDNVLQTLRITHHSLVRMGMPQPRIAVAGLNPHAGEGGLFGHEEEQTIKPAVLVAQREGLDASGPWPPDTVFMRARHAPGHPGEFDVVVAMYHDQGLIPVKYLGVAEGVNVTLGLPIVRTSPDHGTAFDLAGSGRADPASFARAMQLARSLSRA